MYSLLPGSPECECSLSLVFSVHGLVFTSFDTPVFVFCSCATLTIFCLPPASFSSIDCVVFSYTVCELLVSFILSFIHFLSGVFYVL